MENYLEYVELFKQIVIEYGLQVIGAVLALVIGLWIIKALTGGLVKLMKNRDVDASLRPFLRTLFNITLKLLLVISIASMIGIPMTSFIAIMGAAGLAIGMALAGTLQNFAGGVMLLLFKPFKVGDFIEAQGHMGTVREIQVFNTILKTPDNKTIIIPNGGLSNNSMINFSTEKTRRVEFTFGIAYGDDTAKARTILMQLIEGDTRILKDPEPFVALKELGDSSVNMVVRVWVESGDYWGVYFDMNDKVYNTFNAEGLNIPFPQMDVHLHQQ